MKIYEGQRTAEGCVVTVREEGQPPRRLDPRFDLRNHSATGFEWGYGGSGPAQLALALAADFLQDDEKAQDVYQDLKWKVVVDLPKDHWTITERALRAAIRSLGKDEAWGIEL